MHITTGSQFTSSQDSVRKNTEGESSPRLHLQQSDPVHKNPLPQFKCQNTVLETASANSNPTIPKEDRFF